MRNLAARKLAHEPSNQTLQPTALVHGAYLRLTGDRPGQRKDSRGHFFAAAAEAMRRILVENARRKARRPSTVAASARPAPAEFHRVAESARDLLDLDDALTPSLPGGRTRR